MENNFQFVTLKDLTDIQVTNLLNEGWDFKGVNIIDLGIYGHVKEFYFIFKKNFHHKQSYITDIKNNYNILE